jgi:hypothetical protein
MNLIDILTKAGFAGAELLALLVKAKEFAPVLAVEIDQMLTVLATSIVPGNLISLAEALPKELANIAAGNLDPRKHPSDVA